MFCLYFWAHVTAKTRGELILTLTYMLLRIFTLEAGERQNQTLTNMIIRIFELDAHEEQTHTSINMFLTSWKKVESTSEYGVWMERRHSNVTVDNKLYLCRSKKWSTSFKQNIGSRDWL